MIPRDKLLHLALGVIAIMCAGIALLVYEQFGLGPCLAFTTTMVGGGYEVQQQIRKEGEPDVMDAIATAIPGWIAWAIMELL